MSLGLTNIQKVSLTQSLSPQIQLTIKLLKLNNLELEDFIQKKIEENPLLIQNDNLKDPAETRTSKIDDKFTKNTTDIDLINNINYSKSLREHLLEQLIIANLETLDDGDSIIGILKPIYLSLSNKFLRLLALLICPIAIKA